MNEYLKEPVVDENFEDLGKTVKGIISEEDSDVEIVNLLRQGRTPESFKTVTRVAPGDVLRIRGSASEVAKFVKKKK